MPAEVQGGHPKQNSPFQVADIYLSNCPFQVAKEELALECDYMYEAKCQQRFKALTEAEPAFAGKFSVPRVVPELCAAGLLTTERVPGIPVDQVRNVLGVFENLGLWLVTILLAERILTGAHSSLPGMCAAGMHRSAFSLFNLAAKIIGCKVQAGDIYLAQSMPKHEERLLSTRVGAVWQVRLLAPEVRNAVGTRLLQLTLHELFHWRFMQTDPNW